MSRDLALSLLRAGNNGEQILQILDTLSDGFDANEPAAGGFQPTADAIDF
jgi:hypothetical protein